MFQKTGRSKSGGVLLFLSFIFIWAISVPQSVAAKEPCIVNIYNFVRENDYRIADSRAVLFDATSHQVRLLKKAALPATFALQYDALIDTNYQNLFKNQPRGKFEIGAWWEIPQALATRAGLKWRGQHEWDPEANVGFSPGYTPEERRKLVDAYMADFKAIFGYYPKTVGSWYIDEVTLGYMAAHYGIVASCNCKDQIGTDFYTLWGGYWNQAYYPSRLNAYMPAQTARNQIDVPIFRMLGSDPIYQYGDSPGMHTLEPVYTDGGGGSPEWVDWFVGSLIRQPSLAFAYAQAGQENSFGWQAMKIGYTYQVSLLARLVKTRQIKAETLAQTGKWFRSHYSLTPSSAIVALNDWKHENRKTVWYESRFYRLNLLWQNGQFFIRDLHCFDEKAISPTHDAALTATSLAYETLPVVDTASGAGQAAKSTGMWPVLLSPDGSISLMTPIGPPLIHESGQKQLRIQQSLGSTGTFTIICSERQFTCAGVDGKGRPLHWAWDLSGVIHESSALQRVSSDAISGHYLGRDYTVRMIPGQGSCRGLDDGSIRFTPNASGTLALDLESNP